MHAEGSLRDAVLKLIEERHAAVLVVDVDLHALRGYLGVAGELGGEGVVVCGEEASAADVRGDVVQDGLSDGNAGREVMLVEVHRG